MFRLQYASKLYIGRRCDSAADWSKIIKPAAPVLALCGDIGSPFCEQTAKFIRWTTANWDRVLWVPGVEEWATTAPHTMADVPAAMAALDRGRLTVMNNTTWSWHKGNKEVVFLGTTLWGPCRILNDTLSHRIEELRRIYCQPIGEPAPRPIRPYQITAANRQAVKWLLYHIDDCRDEDNKRPIVILSYTTPSLQPLSQEDRFNVGRLPMRNILDSVIDRPIHTWIYGDVNRNFSATNEITGVNFTANTATCPIGYSPRWTAEIRTDELCHWYPPVRTSTLLSTAPSLALPFDDYE